MERTNFEKLEVYKLSEKLADIIWNIVNEWDSFSKNSIGMQLVRACDSIGANIAEAECLLHQHSLQHNFDHRF